MQGEVNLHPPKPHLQIVHCPVCGIQAVPDLSIRPEHTLVCHIFACCFQVCLKQVQSSTFLFQHLLDSWLHVLWCYLVPGYEQSIRQQRIAAGADGWLCWRDAVALLCLRTHQAACKHVERTPVDAPARSADLVHSDAGYRPHSHNRMATSFISAWEPALHRSLPQRAPATSIRDC